MKKTLLVVAVAALIASAFSFATARWLAGREIQQRHGQYRARFDALCAAHCDARFALGEQLGRPLPDPDRCREHVAKMNAAQAAAEQATLEHILAVRAVLTDAQAQRYGKLVGDQVCSMPRSGSL